MRTIWELIHALRVPITPKIWGRFAMMLRELSRSEQGGRARALFTLLLLFMFAINGLNVISSYVNRDFMTAIENRDIDGFWSYAGLYLVVFAVSTAVAVLYRFVEESLGLVWRKWLTGYVVDRYLESRTFFWLYVRGELSNPDQRISEDIRALTATTLSFVLMILNATFTVIAFSGVLWSISPTLFLVAVCYSILGSALTIYLGKPLVKLNYDQLDREADFRSNLLRVRENAESIAMLRREGRLRARLRNRLDSLTVNFQKIIQVNRNLSFFTTGYNYLIQIIPVLIVAPVFIHGDAQFGVITQSAVAFGHLLGAFSLIVTQFQSISSYTAVVARLNGLQDAFKKKRPDQAPQVEVSESCASIAYSHLTLYAPRDGRVLLRDLSLSVPTGTCLLVRADGESAEKALFRATADLWDFGEGRILHPGHDALFFLPERPYLPPGTLREALLRTGEEKVVADGAIIDALKLLALESVLERAGGLDCPRRSWADLLSLGEQQRLSFARVLLADARFVFLDHPSRSLSECAIGELLALLRQRNITYLTLGDEADDPRFYDRLLVIAEDGSWRLRHPGGGETTGNGVPPFDELAPVDSGLALPQSPSPAAT